MNRTDDRGTDGVFMEVEVDGVLEWRRCELYQESQLLTGRRSMGRPPPRLRPLLNDGEELIEVVGGGCVIARRQRPDPRTTARDVMASAQALIMREREILFISERGADGKVASAGARTVIAEFDAVITALESARGKL